MAEIATARSEVTTAVPDVGRLARLEEVKKDATTPSVVFQRLTDGETLKAIAKAWGIPKGPFIEWYVTTHAERYDAALRVIAAELGHGAKEILDEATEDSIPLAKLRFEGYLKLASKFDRKRFGDGQEVNVTVKDERTPLSREELLLEVARDVGFVLASADHVKADRALLPRPAPTEVADAEVVAPPGAEAPI